MKITTGLFCISLAMAATATSGCASQQKLTHEQILNQNQKVAKLDSALQQAAAKDAALLTPNSYAKASISLANAMAAARNNDTNLANKSATKGLQTIDKLNHNTSRSREILSEVLQARDRAYKAGAETLQGEKISALDADLKKATVLIEKGDIEQAKQRRSKLISGYSQLELEALKQGTVDLAETAIANTKQQGAKKYAPKTLAHAQEEMALAKSILDADRSQIDKANVHATKAKMQAEQSAAITETIKDFDRRDYTMEDIILWHQQQLQSVNAPLGSQLLLNEPSEKVVLNLKNAVAQVVDERNIARDQLEQAVQQADVQARASHEKITTLMSTSQTEKQADRAEQEKFEVVQAMFNENEAKVYRQRQNVLVSAHGFQFPSGRSEIQADNFPLMNKIIRAIKTFPGSRIEVAGHSDSAGNDASNQALSQARAEKVAKFLSEVGDIPVNRILSRGFGETRPVATNETAKGRAENRRVEIKIINN